MDSSTIGLMFSLINKNKQTINNNHIFPDRTARDAYFESHKDELSMKPLISLGSKFQQWDGASWIDKTSIISPPIIQISKVGETGDYNDLKNKPSIAISTSGLIKDDVYSKDETELKITELKDDINNKKDELVKMNIDDIAGYLETKIDNSTIQIVENKLVAKTLKGLQSSIDELNMLQGTQSNIQGQINNLTKGMEYKGQFDTFTQLSSVLSPKSGWTAIVKADETQDGRRMFYIYDGLKWESSYEISAQSMGRDFLTDGIDLEKETKGILPQNKMNIIGLAKATDLDNKINKVLAADVDSIVILNSDGSIKSGNKKISDMATKIHKHQAIDVELNTSTFNKNLDNSTTNVQLLAEKVDKLVSTSEVSGSIDDLKPSTKTTYSSDKIDKITGNINDTALPEELKDRNLVEMISETFQSGVDAKKLVVTALTSRGVNVTANNNFNELSQAIINLTIPPSTLQTTKLNVGVGEKKIISYGRDLSNLIFATSMLKFKQGATGITEKICSFNNGDESNFVYDNNKTIFDGKMKPKNDFIVKAYSTSELGVNGKQSVFNINLSDYKSIGSINTSSEDTLEIKATKHDSFIVGKGDIDIRNIEKLKKINLNMQGYKIIISFDSGITWNSYFENKWNQVDAKVLNEIKSKGMTKATLDSLTDIQIEELRKGRSILKLGYYQEQNKVEDIVYTDELDLVVDIKGIDVIADQSDWSYSIYTDRNSIEYTFKTAGTYTINRI